jgi:hypothetical protein
MQVASDSVTGLTAETYQSVVAEFQPSSGYFSAHFTSYRMRVPWAVCRN